MAPAGLTARIYVAPADPARGDISAWQRLCPSGDIFFDREAAGPYSGLMKSLVTMTIGGILPVYDSDRQGSECSPPAGRQLVAYRNWE